MSELLTVPEAAEILGTNRNYVYYLVKRGDLVPWSDEPLRFLRRTVEALGSGWRRRNGPTHGLASTYRSPIYACRCEACTQANTERVVLERQKRANRQPPAGSHGKYTTYTNWMCRCGPCKVAGAEKNKRYADAHREELRAYNRRYYHAQKRDRQRRQQPVQS